MTEWLLLLVAVVLTLGTSVFVAAEFALVSLDRSLVADMHKDADHNAVIAAIVALGKALGIKVVAKGVENDAQKAMLLAAGCDFLQGYLTGRPADADTAAKDYV